MQKITRGLMAATGILAASVFAAPVAGQTLTLEALTAPGKITVDGDPSDWAAHPGIVVPLQGNGGVDSVELKAAVRGDRIYLLAIWRDSTESRLHKPYQWDEATGKYKRTRQLEDRFAVSFAMTGDFSASKLSGAEFTADVWHWKASRSDPAGVAHDKMWKVSRSAFPKAREFKSPDGTIVYMLRMSDKGDRLYKPLKYTTRQDDVMPRYRVNLTPSGSIADVRAKGVWKNGRWYLEMSRLLNTGNADDAVIPRTGEIEIAVAGFNDVDGRSHSTSEIIVLRTTTKTASID
jgi:hypothetical protein